MRRSLETLFAVLITGLVAAGLGCDQGGGQLVVEAPGRILQAAASDDGTLCGRLAVDLTFDNVGDGADPLLLEEPLVAGADGPCVFELPSTEERRFPRGTYDAMVRFLAKDGAYEGSDSCDTEGVASLWVGAYVLEGLSFPDEPLRFSEDAFLSLPGQESALPVPGVSFDVDGDERDNLAEVAAGSSPCIENRPPTVDLDVASGNVAEGAPITVQLSSRDPAGLRHRVTLRIRHDNGPTVGTEVITWRRFTSAPAQEDLSPDPETADLAEGWSLTVDDATEDGGGALDVTLTFVPDEPFVGALSVELVADDGYGNVLAEALPASIVVEDLDDPTRLLFEDADGNLAPATRVDFREVGPGLEPTVRRFKIADDDLDEDVSQWTVEFAPGNPDGLSLERDLSFWKVSWAPGNAEAVASPDGGYSLILQFLDGGGLPVGAPQQYPIGITPLYNDPPALGDLSGLDRSLPSGPFAYKRLQFTLHDPDEAPGEPTCTVEVVPAGDTPCATGWAETRCEVDGARAGDAWPFTLTLTPSASYFDDCGSTPSFELRISVADAAPPGAEPSTPQVAATEADCAGQAACVEHLVLYTAEALSTHTVAGGPGAPVALGASQELVIDGVQQVGVFFGDDEAEERVFIVDLSTQTPTYAHKLERTQLCRFHEGYLRVPHAVAVDEVNHRVVGFGYAGAAVDDCYNASRVVFSLSTLPPYDVTTWPLEEACAAACTYYGCAGRPAADAAGNVYLPCGGDTGTLLRVDGANQLSTRDFPRLNDDQDVWGVAAVEAPDGRSWFVWPDLDGLLFVETTTWDDATVRSERLTLTGWNSFYIGQGRADPWRGDYLLAYLPTSNGVGVQLHRVTFDTGTPVLEAPLVVGDIGSSSSGDRYLRFLLKPPVAGQPAGEPDLVLTGRVLDNNRIYVDLDSFTVVPGRAAEDYLYLHELYESPDPRFFVGWVKSSSAGYEGFRLFPWDPTAPYQVQEVPGTWNWRQQYMRHWSTSHTGRLAAISDSGGVMRILRFQLAP